MNVDRLRPFCRSEENDLFCCQMIHDFTYRADRRTRRLSLIWVGALVALVGVLVLYSRSGYFPTWFLFFLVTVGLLYILSIPRRIRVTDEALEIHCTVELTSVALEDIASIRRMEPDEMRFSMPLLGSYGFFGYYGWFYNFQEFSLFKVYCSQWKDFVRIDDIYETTYVVNCADAEALIECVLQKKAEFKTEA